MTDTNWNNLNGEVVAAQRMGCFDIISIGVDLENDIPAWRWMAVVKWYEPGDVKGFPRMVCRRTLCPLRLARWVYMVARRIAQGKRVGTRERFRRAA